MKSRGPDSRLLSTTDDGKLDAGEPLMGRARWRKHPPKTCDHLYIYVTCINTKRGNLVAASFLYLCLSFSSVARCFLPTVYCCLFGHPTAEEYYLFDHPTAAVEHLLFDRPTAEERYPSDLVEWCLFGFLPIEVA